MLKNIIFDMGNVLISFVPEYFIERMGIGGSDKELLLDAIFQSDEWPLLDNGELIEEEFETIVQKRIPERLYQAAHQLIFGWDDPLVPVPGMAEFVEECKRAGMGIYLLSNASRHQRDYWERVPGHEFFDGRVISAEERCVKPMKEIYQCLLERYQLKAEECLFVDDVQENVDAAIREGMHAVLFTGDVDAVRAEARMLGMNADYAQVP